MDQARVFYTKNYELLTNYFVVPTRRIILGPNCNRICRFCEKDETKTTFDTEAHAIPELLGNKSIFSNYECDDCNQFFGIGIENDLGNWTKPSRTLSQIHGKRGVPSIKKLGPGQPWRIDYDDDGLHFKEYESDPHFEVDIEKRQVRFDLTRDVYTPVAVLKAFVKIGLTLLPPEELPNFKESLSWICEQDHTKSWVSKYPVFHTFHPGPRRHDLLVVRLMRRRDSIVNLPYTFLVLGFGNDVYQVFIPCPQRDSMIYHKNLTIPFFPTAGVPNPEKYGRSQVTPIDLSGRQRVAGETLPRAMGFEHMEVIEGSMQHK